MTKARIAIIGNMNNSGFALLRYFRDLGADAWLLPYATDGQGNLAHFAPEADTVDIGRWRDWISPLHVPNSSAAFFNLRKPLSPGSMRRQLETALSTYRYFVGSGVAPALFHRLRRRLDIYFPYGTGIEFFGDFEFLNRMHSSPVHRIAYQWLRRQQAAGIRAASHCLNAEMSLTAAAFKAIGRSFERLAIPAVYNREPSDACVVPPPLRAALERLRASELGLFCCSRQLWVRDPRFDEATWKRFTKNSDWLMHGLAGLLKAHPGARPVLAIVAYGPDVEASQRLAAELGIADHVLWLPKMQRREIMHFLACAHVGVGEFYQDEGLIWGGTGWEVLASGRPLLQSFNFSEAGFTEAFGHPPPPLLDVKSPEDVTRRLLTMWRDPQRRLAIGSASRAWFDENNGIGLARRWLRLLDTGREDVA